MMRSSVLSGPDGEDEDQSDRFPDLREHGGSNVLDDLFDSMPPSQTASPLTKAARDGAQSVGIFSPFDCERCVRSQQTPGHPGRPAATTVEPNRTVRPAQSVGPTISPMVSFQFGSALSTLEETSAALDEVITLAAAPIDRPHLVVAFATPHHTESAEMIATRIAELVGDRGTSVAVVADGVIGGPREIDVGPGLSLWAAVLPGVDVVSSHLEAVRTPQGVAVGGWAQAGEPRGVILLADPFSFPAGSFASSLGERDLPVVGGLVSGGGPGKATLIRNGEVLRRGAVCIVFGGPIDFRTVVSQGCRPIGEPSIVTKADGTTIREIGGRPALEYLQDTVDTLEEHDRRLVQGGLQIGVAADEYRSDFGRGDFLVRGVVAADPDSGTISIGEQVSVGQTVQFQVRDPGGADEDLRALLDGEPTGTGVLIFSCNGRGSRFFGEPDHDAAVVAELLRPQAAAGLFAAGELGPVGGANHLHGFTASILELRPI